jgi:protein O-mannosyl-transferase
LRVANAMHATVCYLGQMFYPLHLAVFYPYPQAVPSWAQVLAESLLLGGITVTVFLLARSRPYGFVGWFWFLGTLVPVIGLVQVGAQARADRYTYIPLIGLFLLLVWGLRALVPKRGDGLLACVMAGILLACVLQSRDQVSHWVDSLHLWKHATEVTTDNGMAHLNYGEALFKQGEIDEALRQIKIATQLEAKMEIRHAALAHHREGKIYESLQRWDEAEACFRAAILLRPFAHGYRWSLEDFEANRSAFNENLETRRALLDVVSGLGQVSNQPNPWLLGWTVQTMIAPGRRKVRTGGPNRGP